MDKIESCALAVFTAIEATQLDNEIAAVMPATWRAALAGMSDADATTYAPALRLALHALLDTPDAPRLLIARLADALAPQGA